MSIEPSASDRTEVGPNQAVAVGPNETVAPNAEEEIHDPDDPEPSTPGKQESDAERDAWASEYDAWCERLDAYLLTADGQRRSLELQRRLELANRLVESAETRAAVTCELCGAPSQLHRTPARWPWYKTLCPACAQAAKYVPAAGR